MAGTETSNDTTTKNEIHKCKTCKVKCPDIHSYVEHLESKDHKKGVMKEKYGEKYLEAKAKLDDIPKDQIVSVPEKKPALPKDIPKPKMDEDSSSDESSEEDEVYTCEICRKICTGFISYQLHLEGQKHHKNVKKAKLLKQMKENNLIPKASEEKPIEQQSLLDRIMTTTQFASSDIECKTCQKKCCGPEAFKQHCKSAGHQKKLAMQSLLEEMKSEGLSPALQDDDSPFACCDVCQKSFTGLLPYQQHMESITHLRQARHVEQLSKIKDLIINSEEDSNKFQCKECGKSFSGPVPFNAHLKSFAHEKLKKKSSQMEYLLKKHPEMVRIPVQQDSETEDTDEEDGVLLGCDVCRMVCSGPEAARDHFASAKHKKAAKQKAQFLNYMKQQKAGASGQRKLKSDKRLKAYSDSDSSEFDIIQDA